MGISIRSILAAMLACGVLVGSAAASAQAPDNQSTLRARYDQLFQEMLERPADLDLMFAFAETATRLGEYDSAISTLERMLIFNPNLPRVKMELAALYMRVGAYEVARTYLDQAVAAPDVPPLVRQRAQEMRDEIEQRTSRHYFAGSVFGGIRYQSNANAGPTGGDVRTPVGVLPLDDEFRKQDDFNAFLSGMLLHRYDLGTRHREYWESRAVAYGALQFDVEDLDIALIEAQTGPLLALFPDRWEGTTIRPYFVANAVSLDSDLLYTTVGLGAELAHRVSDRLLLTLEPSLRHLEFRNSDAEPNGDERTGVRSEARIGARYRLQDDVLLFAEAGYANENAKAEFESTDEYGALLGLTWTYRAPIAGIRVPWELTGAVGYRIVDYKAPDPNVVGPGGTERYDQEWRFLLTNSFSINDAWSIEAQLGYEINDSNIRNFDRDNFTALVGALFSF